MKLIISLGPLVELGPRVMHHGHTFEISVLFVTKPKFLLTTVLEKIIFERKYIIVKRGNITNTLWITV